MGLLGRDLEALHHQVLAEYNRHTSSDPHPHTPPAAAPRTAGGTMPPPALRGEPRPGSESETATETGTPAAGRRATPSQSVVPPSSGRNTSEAAGAPQPADQSHPAFAHWSRPPSPTEAAARGRAGAEASSASGSFVPEQPAESGATFPAGAPIPPAVGQLPGQAQPGAPVGPGFGGARPGWMGGGQPMYQPYPAAQPPRRLPAREPRTPWWQREGVISRVLAVAGVGVTLIGVVMLLVLAAQAGFFGPVPRVVAGAVFSAALVAVGMRVHGRAGGRVGAVALAATGIAGGYLDVVAVTAVYGWLHPVLGYAVALGIAAGGVGLALQWRSQALAVLVVLGAALLSPAVTTELALLAFLIVLQIAALPVQLVRDWPYLHIVRTVPAVLATLIAVAMASLGDEPRGHRYEVLAAAVAVAVVGLAGAVLVVRRRAGDVTASLTFAAATVPLLAAPTMFERRTAVIVSAAFAVALLLVAVLPWLPKVADRVRIPGHLAAVAAVAGACAVLEACLGATRVQTLPIALYLVALAVLAVAGQQRSRVAAGIGAAFTVLGTLAFLANATPEMLAEQRYAEERLGISTALAAIAALAVLAAVFWCVRRLGLAANESETTALAVISGIAGLYAVTALAVSVGVATGNPDGFLAGHGIATVVWMATATTALLFGLRRLSRTPQQAKVALAAGLLVTAAALAKLFLFDLATLDGLVRAGAFLVVGVLLLLAGTRYARAFAEAGNNGAPSH
ncbi:hypothetical protein Ntsu_75850 [Nocardia sp. IFM 10818]